MSRRWNLIRAQVSSAATLAPTILLVEDEKFVREVTSRVLESAGYRVLKASNAAEAIAAFRSHEDEVLLLITDVVMPGQNGRDLAQQLGALCPALKTLFISGYPENPVTSNGGERTFYLPKPFSLKSLMCSVRRVLGDSN